MSVMNLSALSVYSNLYGYVSAFIVLSLSGFWLYAKSKENSGLALGFFAFVYVACQIGLWFLPGLRWSYSEGDTEVLIEYPSNYYNFIVLLGNVSMVAASISVFYISIRWIRAKHT